MNSVNLGWPLAVLLLTLASLAGIITQVAGLGPLRSPVFAALRAVAQLAAVSTIIVAVLHSLGATLLFLCAMSEGDVADPADAIVSMPPRNVHRRPTIPAGDCSRSCTASEPTRTAPRPASARSGRRHSQPGRAT